MHPSPADYVLRPGDYLVALALLGLGFLIREFVFRAGGSLWDELRHLFDIEVPTALEEATARVATRRLAPVKRRSCPRCGSAMVFNSAGCDTCVRLGIPPAPAEPAWAPPIDVVPVDFASHATWARAHAVPDRQLGPAVLRLKVAMGSVLFMAAGNVALAGFDWPGWIRLLLLASAAISLPLLFAIRRKSGLAVLVCAALIGSGAVAVFSDAALDWPLLGARVVALLLLVQAWPAVRQLRDAEGRVAHRDVDRAA